MTNPPQTRKSSLPVPIFTPSYDDLPTPGPSTYHYNNHHQRTSSEPIDFSKPPPPHPPSTTSNNYSTSPFLSPPAVHKSLSSPRKVPPRPALRIITSFPPDLPAVPHIPYYPAKPVAPLPVIRKPVPTIHPAITKAGNGFGFGSGSGGGRHTNSGAGTRKLVRGFRRKGSTGMGGDGDRGRRNREAVVLEEDEIEEYGVNENTGRRDGTNTINLDTQVSEVQNKPKFGIQSKSKQGSGKDNVREDDLIEGSPEITASSTEEIHPRNIGGHKRNLSEKFKFLLHLRRPSNDSNSSFLHLITPPMDVESSTFPNTSAKSTSGLAPQNIVLPPRPYRSPGTASFMVHRRSVSSPAATSSSSSGGSSTSTIKSPHTGYLDDKRTRERGRSNSSTPPHLRLLESYSAPLAVSIHHPHPYSGEYNSSDISTTSTLTSLSMGISSGSAHTILWNATTHIAQTAYLAPPGIEVSQWSDPSSGPDSGSGGLTGAVQSVGQWKGADSLGDTYQTNNRRHDAGEPEEDSSRDANAGEVGIEGEGEGLYRSVSMPDLSHLISS